MNSDELDILLVEDNQDDMDLALHALRREKLANHIFVARDGEEALDFLFCRGAFADRLFDKPPKLVLLDLKLPKVDGLTLFQKGFSWGGTASLAVMFPNLIRPNRDYGGRLVRLNVGLEEPEDLIEDLARALKLIRTAA